VRDDIMPKRLQQNSQVRRVCETAAVQHRESTLPGLSEKTTDALSAPTHTQPGGFIGRTGLFFGAGRSTATMTGLICQLGPNFWAAEKRNCRRLLYTTFGVEAPYRSTGKAGRETFQRGPKNDVRRVLQRDAAIPPCTPRGVKLLALTTSIASRSRLSLRPRWSGDSWPQDQ
jgi:hypothetical protein